MTLLRMREVIRKARATPETWVPIQGEWSVKAVRIANMPRGGAMKAWKFYYYLQVPEALRKQHGGTRNLGGYDRADAFISWAKKKMQEN